MSKLVNALIIGCAFHASCAAEIYDDERHFLDHVTAYKTFCFECDRGQDFFEMGLLEYPARGKLVEIEIAVALKQITVSVARSRSSAVYKSFINSSSKRFDELRYRQIVNRRKVLGGFSHKVKATKRIPPKLSIEEIAKLLPPEEHAQLFGAPLPKVPRYYCHVPKNFDPQKLIAHIHAMNAAIDLYDHNNSKRRKTYLQGKKAIELRHSFPLYFQIASKTKTELPQRVVNRHTVAEYSNVHDPKNHKLCGYVQEIIDKDTFMLVPRSHEKPLMVHLASPSMEKTLRRMLHREVRCDTLSKAGIERHYKGRKVPRGFVATTISPSDKTMHWEF